MPEKDFIRIGCYISKLLRHKPEIAGLKMDKNGWVKVSELIRAVNQNKAPLTMEELVYIVENDNKQRYSFNKKKTLIRANQGHSISVDVKPAECIPPAILWHGTAEKYVRSIEEIGLIAKTRLFVHLSSDYATAVNVGRRHGPPVVYRVDTARMSADGYKFFLSKNNVWLTKAVPAEYIKRTKPEDTDCN